MTNNSQNETTMDNTTKTAVSKKDLELVILFCNIVRH